MNIAGIAEERVRDQGEQVSLIYEGKEFTNVEMLTRKPQAGPDPQGSRGEAGRPGHPPDPQLPGGAPGVLGRLEARGAWSCRSTTWSGRRRPPTSTRIRARRCSSAARPFSPRSGRAGEGTRPGDRDSHDADAPQGFLSYPQLVGESPEETEVEDTDDDDLAALIYTAGHDGPPQGGDAHPFQPVLERPDAV